MNGGLKKLFFTFFAAGALFVMFPTVAFADNYTVATQNDTLSGSCGGSCSLRDAVIAANARAGSDTIILPAGTYNLNNFTDAGEEVASEGDLDITDTSGTLTITGAGSGSTSINGNATDRVFDIKTNTTVTMSGLTITNGSVTDENGGGILNLGALTISNSIISNNDLNGTATADYYGAGIQCGGGSITITDSTISGNYSASTPGYFIYGGGLNIGSSCNATITRALFSSNTFEIINSLQFGGGINIFTSDSTTVSITDTVTSSNTAIYGGGVMVSGATGHNTVELNRFTADSNHSYLQGGGVYLAGKANFTNATFFDNRANNAGGGIYMENQTYTVVRLYNTTIVKNYSQALGSGTYHGGGFYTAGSSVDLKVNGSIIAENFRGDPEGAVTDADCYETGVNNDVLAYSLLGVNTNCAFTTVTDTTVGATGQSATSLESAILANNGGSVETVAFQAGDTDIIDALPAAQCVETDDSTLLTEDARQFTRPEQTDCDVGAYELDQTPPSAPADFTGISSGSTVALSWTNPVSDFSSVTIRRGASSYPTTITDGSPVASGISTTTYLDTGLSDGTYYYSIFALDSTGNASVRAQTTVTVVADSSTEAPSILTPTAGSYNSVHISYSLPENPLTGSVQVVFTNTDSQTTTFTMSDATSADITFSPTSTNSAVLAANPSAINGITSSFSTVLPDDTYTVTLKYRDQVGNPVATDEVESIVIDTVAPTITLLGESTVSIGENETYVDAGSTASDAVEGDVTSRIVITNSVDTTTPGTYTVIYAVSDSIGNVAENVTRTVVVEAAETVSEMSDPVVSTDGKYIIVTVDGIEVDRLQVNATTLKQKQYSLLTKDVYSQYTSILLLTVKKNKAKLTVVRLTKDNQLKKKVVRTFSIQDRRDLSLKVKKRSKRIVAQVGKNEQKVKKIYRLTKSGKLNIVL